MDMHSLRNLRQKIINFRFNRLQIILTMVINLIIIYNFKYNDLTFSEIYYLILLHSYNNLREYLRDQNIHLTIQLWFLFINYYLIES